jgi:Holin of 3TMs, for gene-transfer release
MATAEEYAKMSDAEKKKEDWMNSKWRPMMGWMYMAVCTADFVIFPVLWSIVQVWGGGEVKTQWSPITLQGAGLFHMAMGAVLGLAAWGRTQEKMAGANNGGIQSTPSATPSFGAPSAPSSFSAPSPTPSFGSAPAAKPSFGGSPSFGSSPAPAVGMSASGKPMPMLQDDREL